MSKDKPTILKHTPTTTIESVSLTQDSNFQLNENGKGISRAQDDVSVGGHPDVCGDYDYPDIDIAFM